jgi:hypothetical protein
MFPTARVLKAGYPGHPHRDNVAFPTRRVLKKEGRVLRQNGLLSLVSHNVGVEKSVGCSRARQIRLVSHETGVERCGVKMGGARVCLRFPIGVLKVAHH